VSGEADETAVMGETLAWTVGWALVLEYALGASAVAVGWSNHVVGALAAARRECDAVGIDYVPALLERGRIRAEAEHLSVEFVEGDAEELPFSAASFDAVVSIYGVMFAPNHQRAAGGYSSRQQSFG